VFLFGASLMGVAMTYVGTTIGSNLLPGRFGVVDALLPLLLTVAEGWPFLLLFQGNGIAFTVRVWLVSMGVFNLVAAGLLAWIRRRMRRTAYTEQVWKATMIEYRVRLLYDRRQAADMGLVLVALGALSGPLFDWAGAEAVAIAVGAVTMAGYGVGLKMQEQVARGLSEVARV
jgi:hypothetical protein